MWLDFDIDVIIITFFIIISVIFMITGLFETHVGLSWLQIRGACFLIQAFIRIRFSWDWLVLSWRWSSSLMTIRNKNKIYTSLKGFKEVYSLTLNGKCSHKLNVAISKHKCHKFVSSACYWCPWCNVNVYINYWILRFRFIIHCPKGIKLSTKNKLNVHIVCHILLVNAILS